MGLLVRFLLQSFSPSLEVVLYKKIDCQSKRCPLNFLCSKNFQGWLLKIFNGWIFLLKRCHHKLFTRAGDGNWLVLSISVFQQTGKTSPICFYKVLYAFTRNSSDSSHFPLPQNSTNVAKTISLPMLGWILNFLRKQIHSENHVIFS